MHSMKCLRIYRSKCHETQNRNRISRAHPHCQSCIRSTWERNRLRPHKLQGCRAALSAITAAVAAAPADIQPLYAAIPVSAGASPAASGNGGPVSCSVLPMAEPDGEQHAWKYVLVG